MAINVELTRDEFYIILGALCATSPTGGGSDEFTLFRSLSGLDGEIDQDRLYRIVTRDCNTVVSEYQQSLEG